MVLILVLLVSITAALLLPGIDVVNRTGSIAVYLIWCVLPAIGLLCFFRQTINRKALLSGLMLALGCCLLPFLVLEMAWQFWLLGDLDYAQLFRRFMAATIIVLLILRVFSLLGLLEYRSAAEANARFEALQSKIRPHFLFNSLNTIAELTHEKPQHAEQALLSLSMLFRASLESEKKWYSLDSEITLCRRYIELETWRLGDNLNYSENIDVALAQEWYLPRLILQPLIENAFVHGGKADGSLDLQLEVKETKSHLSILLVNSSGEGKTSQRDSAGMAVDNIKQRLFTLYDDQASLRTIEQDDQFKVFVKLPKLRASQTAS